MSERPILFSGAMVRAILSGAKTQTRRVVACKHCVRIAEVPVPARSDIAHAPYGQPGDRLWVREAFMPCPLENPTTGPSRWNIAYASDAEQVERQAPAGYNPMLYNYERWTPSIHMPRWASRIKPK